MPQLNVRVPDHLMRAARSAAAKAGTLVTVWVRQLVERETGVSAGEMQQGKNRVSEARRKEIASAGGKARWAKNRG